MDKEPVGAKLKKIRQELGLSLEEAQKKTKIHLNILKAIEGDTLTGLSPVYLKGFLKIYCKFLGQDPKDYIPDYKETGNQAANVITDKDAKPARVKLSSPHKIPRKIKLAFIFVVAIVCVAFGLFNLGKFISSRRRAHPMQKRIQKSNQAQAVKVAPKPKAAENKPQKEATSGIRLSIRARENCWVSLKIDGRIVFQRVLEKGRFESWQAKERIELSLGNAGAVELEVNGQLFSNLGRKGQVRNNIVITREGLNFTR